MGWFEKIRDNILAVVDPQKKEVKKDYYNTAIFLLSHIEYLSAEDIKTYIEAKGNGTCDEGMLDVVLSKFEKHVYSEKNYYCLTFEQKNKEKVESTATNLKEIYSICYPDLIEDVKAKYQGVIEVIKDNPNEKHLFDGLDKVVEGYELPHHKQICYDILANEVANKLIDNDPTVTKIMIDEVYLRLYASLRVGRDACYQELFKCAYVLLLRKLHYEKNLENLGEYKTLSNDDFITAVNNSEYYQEKIAAEIKSDPFGDDKVKRTERYAHNLNSVNIIYKSYGWKVRIAKDVRFEDAVCYYGCNAILEAAGCEYNALNIEITIEEICRHITDWADRFDSRLK